MWWTMRLRVALLKKVSLLWIIKLQWNKPVIADVSECDLYNEIVPGPLTHWCILDRLKGAVKLSFSARSGRVSLSNFMGLRGSNPRNLLMRFSILQEKFLLERPEPSFASSADHVQPVGRTLTCSWTCAVGCKRISSWSKSDAKTTFASNT